MALAQKQICGSTEQNREPRNKPSPMQSKIFDKKGKTTQCGNVEVSSTNNAGKTGYPQAKE